jgi:hypothetical protein
VYGPDGLHLWFSSYGCKNDCKDLVTFAINHATSTDGIHWDPKPKMAFQGGLWREMAAGGAQPSVLWNEDACQYEMWFNNHTDAEKATVPAAAFETNAFFRAVSKDASEWTVDYAEGPDFAWDGALETEEYGLLVGVEVVRVKDQYRMYYGAWSAKDVVPGLTPCPLKNGQFVPGMTTLNLATRQ